MRQRFLYPTRDRSYRYRTFTVQCHMTSEVTVSDKHKYETVVSSSYSLTHTNRSIGYHNQTQSLAESTVRLMKSSVYDRRDRSRKVTPSPSLYYSLTHTHRSIGYHNQTQSLGESTTRQMYLRVYDIRNSSYKTTPSPSLCYPVTHPHRSIGCRNQTQSLVESTVRLMFLGLCNSTSQ